MAFSFRMGTNWYHDFPKLAKESGFYFNAHKDRTRVDWNRICSIDIDKVIRERDFLTVDENMNYVIDYSLESEYDIKILDSNFVKLFRLAQLAVEYLLYCKQYLDQSTVILKEELKSKIEESLKLKKHITTVEDQVQNLKENLKDRGKKLETNIDSHGEIHKCPHCTKTFINAMFVRAHISRRHPILSETFSTFSPSHEKYRAETEKLHNEIKTLKERLNQTERIVGSDCNKCSQNISTGNSLKSVGYHNLEPKNNSYKDCKIEEHQNAYRDEGGSLKAMLHLNHSSLKKIGLPGLHDTENENIKELIRQQEKEIQKLRSQIHDNVTTDLENMQDKLSKQEEYWKTKLEQLENQHRVDIESLLTQLKLIQDTANQTKLEYESKVNNLEKQSLTQSEILTVQNERLENISRDIQDTHLHGHCDFESNSFLKSSRGKHFTNDILENKLKTIEIASKSLNENSSSKSLKKIGSWFENLDSPSSHALKRIFKEDNISSENLYSRIPENKTTENSSEKTKKSFESEFATISDSNLTAKYSLTNERNMKENSFLNEYNEDTVEFLKSSTEMFQHDNSNTNLQKLDSQLTEPVTKLDIRKSEKIKRGNNSQETSEEKESKLEIQSSSSDSEESKLSSEGESETEESLTESEKDLLSDSFDEKQKVNTPRPRTNDNTTHENLLLNKLKISLRDNFENELRKISIDPEWSGIPKATYKEKLGILEHRKKLNSKKFRGYDQIRKKLLVDISEILTMRQKQPQVYESIEKSLLNKVLSNIKTKTMKALNIQKSNVQRSEPPILRSKNLTPKASQSVQKFGLDFLPRKLSESDIREFGKENDGRPARKTESQTYENPISKPTSIHSSQITSSRIKNTKDIAAASTLGFKKLSNSYENIKSFFGQVADESRKSRLDHGMTSAEVTSTPNIKMDDKNQGSYMIASNEKEMSPRYNKSVLKSTSGSVGSLVKKKVIFDLKRSPDKNTIQVRSLSENLTDYHQEKNESISSVHNDSSISDKKDQSVQKKKCKSIDNIVLQAK